MKMLISKFVFVGMLFIWFSFSGSDHLNCQEKTTEQHQKSTVEIQQYPAIPAEIPEEVYKAAEAAYRDPWLKIAKNRVESCLDKIC